MILHFCVIFILITIPVVAGEPTINLKSTGMVEVTPEVFSGRFENAEKVELISTSGVWDGGSTEASVEFDGGRLSFLICHPGYGRPRLILMSDDKFKRYAILKSASREEAMLLKHFARRRASSKISRDERTAIAALILSISDRNYQLGEDWSEDMMKMSFLKTLRSDLQKTEKDDD